MLLVFFLPAGNVEHKCLMLLIIVPDESKGAPVFKATLVPEYISNNVLQGLIEQLKFSFVFIIFRGSDRSLRSDCTRDFENKVPLRNLKNVLK